MLNLGLAFDHPDLKKNANGIYPIEEIFYHAVRCGLYHEAALPSNLRFANEQKIVCDDGVLTLPASIIFGFIVAVVVAPTNATETTSKPHFLNFGEFPIPMSHLWGRRAELLWLLEVENESTRLRIEAEQAASLAARLSPPAPSNA